VLRIAGLGCLVAGLFPDRASAVSAGASRTDIRLGLPCSPLLRYHEETATDSDVTLTQPDGRSFVAKSLSRQASGWRLEFFSWSAALAVAGMVLLVLAFRRRRRPAPVEPAGTPGREIGPTPRDRL